MEGSQNQGSTDTLEAEAWSQKVEERGSGKLMQCLLQILRISSPLSNEKSLNSHSLYDLPKMQINSYQLYDKWRGMDWEGEQMVQGNPLGSLFNNSQKYVIVWVRSVEEGTQ